MSENAVMKTNEKAPYRIHIHTVLRVHEKRLLDLENQSNEETETMKKIKELEKQVEKLLSAAADQ